MLTSQVMIPTAVLAAILPVIHPHHLAAMRSQHHNRCRRWHTSLYRTPSLPQFRFTEGSSMDGALLQGGSVGLLNSCAKFAQIWTRRGQSRAELEQYPKHAAESITGSPPLQLRLALVE